MVKADSKTLSKEDEGNETSSLATVAEIIKNARGRMNISSGGKGKKTNTTTIWVHERQIMGAAVNTANTTVLTLTPLNLTETKAIAPLYDVVRCKAIKFRVHANTLTAAGVPANPTATSDGIVVFDYGTNVAMASVVQGMEFRHHVGPFTVFGSGYANSPGADSLQGGFMVSDLVKLTPTPVVDPGILADYLGGNWVSTSDTGVQVGFIKCYVDACGAAVACGLTVYISYLMEYKNRG